MAAARALPDGARWRQLLARGRVYLAQPYRAVGVAGHVGLAVLEVERRVDAALLEPHGFRPRARGVGGGDEEIAAGGRCLRAHVGGDHVEGAVVVAYGGRVYAQPRVGLAQRQLRRSVQHVAYLFPVHEVAAVPQWHAGKKLKRTVHEIEVRIDAAYARVGIEAGNHGIGVGAGGGRCGHCERGKQYVLHDVANIRISQEQSKLICFALDEKICMQRDGLCNQRVANTGSRMWRPNACSILEIVSIERFSVPLSTRDMYCCEHPIFSATAFCVRQSSSIRSSIIMAICCE